MTGSVDVIDQVDFKTIDLLKRASGVEVVNTRGGLHYTYAMNTMEAPFNNADFRLALKYGIDREALLQKVLRGYGTVGNDQPISQLSPYYAADLQQRAFDPDRAKAHLKKAGLDKAKIALSVADSLYPGAVDGVTLYQEQLARCGLQLDVQREPADGYFSNVWMKKPFVATYWAARPTADLMLSTAYISDAKWNDTRWSNKQFDKLVKEARSELDQVKRKAVYRELQTLIRDDGGCVIPLFADNVFAMSKKVAHPKVMSGAPEFDTKSAELPNFRMPSE
jgi:peptide/nickel transport system substrate-binding protein